MPDLPDDDIQRLPDADRIRHRIAERRETDQTDQTSDGAKIEAPGESITHSTRFEQIDDGGHATAMKLEGPEHLDPNDPDSWKVEEVESADFAGAEPPTHGYTENDLKQGDPYFTADGPTAHKSGDIIDPLAPSDDKYIGETEKNLDRIFNEAEQVNAVASKAGVGDSLLDKSSTHFDTPRHDGVVDHKADDVVDHKADDVVDHKADDVVDHKADDVAMKLDEPATGFEKIQATFDDPITQTGLVDAATPHLDTASPKGLPVDENGNSAYEGTVATGGVTDSGSDDDHTDGVFKFAVPTDLPGEQTDSFKSVSGMEVVDEGILPTGETVMFQQTADPVGDALAPLDGGDELIDPAADSADLTAQIDGVHDGGDDGLDDSFGA